MRSFFWAAVIAVIVFVGVSSSYGARAKSRPAKALKNVSASKAPSEMTPAELKAAQGQIDNFQKDLQKRHDKLLKDLYSIRAIAIKERAHETVENIDALIAAEKKAYESNALRPAKK